MLFGYDVHEDDANWLNQCFSTGVPNGVPRNQGI